MRKSTRQSRRPLEADANGKKRNRLPVKASRTGEVLSREQLAIAKWLKEVRFRKKLFGGVNEQEVWKKIEKLNEMYEAALNAERLRYDVLLEQQRLNEDYDPQSDPTRENW